MTPRQMRAVRGSAAAWVATIIAATGHTLAGGGAPAPTLVAAVGVLASPFAVALVGRRLAVWRVGIAVLASQALFHTAFALTAGADPVTLGGHHTVLTVDHAVGLVLPDAPMLIGHVLAAATTIVALYGGERMLRALGRGIRSLFTRVGAVGPLPSIPRLVAPRARLTVLAARPTLSGLSRRGPPALVSAVL